MYKDNGQLCLIKRTLRMGTRKPVSVVICALKRRVTLMDCFPLHRTLPTVTRDASTPCFTNRHKGTAMLRQRLR